MTANTPFRLALLLLLVAPPVYCQSPLGKNEKNIVIVDGKAQALAPQPIDKAFLSENLWNLDIHTFRKALPEHQFSWLSAAKEALIAPPRTLTLFDAPLGETNIRQGNGKIETITANLYNKGDDAPLAGENFDKLVSTWRERISKNLGIEAIEGKSGKSVNARSSLWHHTATNFHLEASTNKETGDGEFIRIRLTPRAALGRTDNGRTASRASLSENVSREGNGDVYVHSVPMVDQGQKGYCVNATLERLLRYYGKDVDQHELAQLTGGNENGTTLDGMVAAMKKATSAFNTRTLVVYEYPQGISAGDGDYNAFIRGAKDYLRDLGSYNRIAKKKGLKCDFPENIDQIKIFDPRALRRGVDPETYAEFRAKSNDCKIFKSRIKQYIDQGIPLCWSLDLGMFPEGTNNRQPQGGHMRMIIGYNEKTDEVIYSDSWGPGHEKKRMKTVHALCMSDMLAVLPPTR